MRPVICLLVLVLCCGCPPDVDKPKPPPTTDGGQAPDGGEQPPPADPLAGSVFSAEQVHAIYAAELAGDPRRSEVLREHRLIDLQGRDVPARVEAYERALKTLAEADPEAWSAFLESLPR